MYLPVATARAHGSLLIVNVMVVMLREGYLANELRTSQCSLMIELEMNCIQHALP